ncbi:hypothetical protein [Compostimonas suwonensis]|uniref:Uncharacterized protein n=1 Tax=Compostimonas suwonensis TaxID=1048394 RepID=A0A2M9C4H3_9MICO|nr:hypothetical protein [Compostimonas suwonensis]PJJ65423.1 hypothetical protein CLV54_0456 [Compostimonas suwonensis]
MRLTASTGGPSGPPRPRSWARGILSVIAVASVVVLAACAPGTPGAPGTPDETAETSAPLTQAQAERLAVARFTNFDDGVRSFTITIPSGVAAAPDAGGVTTGSDGLELRGWIDFATQIGYAAVEQNGASIGLVQFTPQTIAVRETPTDGAPLPIPADGWQQASLDTTASTLTAALGILLDLGSDRPENPQLLRQSDAAWLRSDTVGSGSTAVDVDVFAGPSASSDDGSSQAPTPLSERSRYSVGDDGELWRFEARLGGASEWTTIDFGDADGVTLGESLVGVQ